MRIWASLDDYLAPGKGPKLVGRNFANHQFIKALLEYSHFDEYHFFLENQAHVRLFEEQQGRWLQNSGMSDRVKLFHRLELPGMLATHDYTVFHLADHLNRFNNLCLFRNRHGRFPVTAFIHSLSYPGAMHKYMELLMGGATPADAIICSSASGRTVIENYFQQLGCGLAVPEPQVSLEVIPFGLDGRAFQTLDRWQCRSRLNLAPDEVIGLCFGRFSDYDKMDLFPLLQAFQKIHNKDRPWRLILAGAAHSSDYVEMLRLWSRALNIGDRVSIRTNLSEGEKRDLYGAANFFVSPSDNLQETFGLTLLEALAAGLPLIVSDFDGYREIATEDVARRITTRWRYDDLFSPAGIAPLLDEALLHRYLAQSISVDLEDLAAALKDFFQHPERCAGMGKAARRKFDTQYDYRVVIERLEAYWTELKGRWTEVADPAAVNPLFPDFFQAFSHYVTEQVGPGTRVKRTRFAETLLRIGGNYPLLADMDQLVDPATIHRITSQCRDPIQMADLLANPGASDGTLCYQVLWMLKHGLLQIE